MRKLIIYNTILFLGLSSVAFAQANKKEVKNATVIQNTVQIDSIKNQEALQDITQKVVEATYKNYPQQNGQPTIIINNIILPHDYLKANSNRVNTESNEVMANTSSANTGLDDPEYQTWLRERRYRQQEFMMDGRMNAYNDQDGYGYQTKYPIPDQDNNSKYTFQDRFAEGKPRNSGTWVIPMFGLHASAFEANFKNDQVSGRTGWNAGMDVRIRSKRFFVQPGIHYFNSSMEVSQKDSLSNKTFKDGPRIHSLKAPIMLGVYLTKANSGFFKFNVKGGIVGNYLLAVDKNTQTDFGKDNLNEFSYGANAGIGLEFGFITLDISHEWGITKFIKTSSKNNNILRATIGFKI